MKIDIVQKQAARKYKKTMTISMSGEGNGKRTSLNTAINIRRIQRRLQMTETTTQTIALLALLLKGVMERINPHLWG